MHAIDAENIMRNLVLLRPLIRREMPVTMTWLQSKFSFYFLVVLIGFVSDQYFSKEILGVTKLLPNFNGSPINLNFSIPEIGMVLPLDTKIHRWLRQQANMSDLHPTISQAMLPTTTKLAGLEQAANNLEIVKEKVIE